jgi:hypothetical protein
MIYLLKYLQKRGLNMSGFRTTTFISSLIATSFLATSFFSILPVRAANSNNYINNQGINEAELSAAELKYLAKTYQNDPLSKRLQRLELLAFGSTQYGYPDDRWHNIQSALRNKSTSPNKKTIGVNGVASSLNELEKYVFKTTTPSLSISKRLDKLEAKLFGKTSSGLATENRIARLQKTLGLPTNSGEIAQQPYGNLPPGMESSNGLPSFTFKHIQPDMPNTFGFNGDDLNDPDLSQFETQMNRMFREMERQMQGQMQGIPIYPNQIPRRSPENNSPRIMPSPQREKIPPYNDPHFI